MSNDKNRLSAPTENRPDHSGANQSSTPKKCSKIRFLLYHLRGQPASRTFVRLLFLYPKKEDKTMAKTPKKKKNQLPSGSYRVQVYSHTDADGKKHYKSFTAPSKKLAQAAARMCSYGSATSPESCHPKQYATPTVSWNRLWPCSPQICVSGSPSRSGRNQSFTAQMMTTFGRCCITFREKSWKSPFSWRHLGRFGEVRSVP